MEINHEENYLYKSSISIHIMENPIQMDDWGYPYDLGNLHIVMPWFWIHQQVDGGLNRLSGG